MTNEILCFDCLTGPNTETPAVTFVNGTAVCERCARDRAEALNATFETPPLPPIRAGGGSDPISGF